MGLYCEDIRPRLVFGAEPARALQYLGSNSLYKAMLLLRENPPLRIEPLDEFLRAQRRELLVYQSQLSILLDYLSDQPEYASRLHLLERGPNTGVYRLDAAAPAGASGGSQ
jgi:hypothetical protein